MVSEKAASDQSLHHPCIAGATFPFQASLNRNHKEILHSVEYPYYLKYKNKRG
jgi:hypothetical protein